jgi:hypothetical protein
MMKHQPSISLWYSRKTGSTIWAEMDRVQVSPGDGCACGRRNCDGPKSESSPAAAYGSTA